MNYPTNTDDPKHVVNVTISNTTSECSVSCGSGNKTTTVVSCKGRYLPESNETRIDV